LKSKGTTVSCRQKRQLTGQLARLEMVQGLALDPDFSCRWFDQAASTRRKVDLRRHWVRKYDDFDRPGRKADLVQDRARLRQSNLEGDPWHS
jgi:hypothetical protein